ncbi:hypothetical protein LSAT2_002033 [Lamellibrachia satsuma]|nr:hypothetical protein LSAT2_002033 [Lamellibrachia satsuma]
MAVCLNPWLATVDIPETESPTHPSLLVLLLRNMCIAMNGVSQSNDSDQVMCKECEKGHPVSLYCDDCDEWLCTQCVQAHQRVRITKNHTILLKICTECNDGSSVSGRCVDYNDWLCEECVHAHRLVRRSRGHSIHRISAMCDQSDVGSRTSTSQAESTNQDLSCKSSSCDGTETCDTSLSSPPHQEATPGDVISRNGSTEHASAAAMEEVSERQEVQSQLNTTTDEQMEDKNDDECALCGDVGELICCESCPKSFHKWCHIPVITTVPSGPWCCGLCTKEEDVCLDALDVHGEPSSALSGAKKRKAATGLTEHELKVCEHVLLQLYIHEASMPFWVPVPDEAYYKVIKHPMDFSKIKLKLENHQYQSIYEFLQDIRLIFHNCTKYNKPNSEHSEQWNRGRQLKEFFKQLIGRLLPSIQYKHILLRKDNRLPSMKYQKTSLEKSGLLENPGSLSESSSEMSGPSLKKPRPSSEKPRPSSKKPTSSEKPGPSSETSGPSKKPRPSSEKPGPSPEKPKPSSEKPRPSSEKLGPSSEKPGPSSKKPTSSEKPGPSSEKPGPSKKPRPSSEKPKPSSEKPSARIDLTNGHTAKKPPSPPWIIEEY